MILETWPTVIPVCVDGMDKVLPLGSPYPLLFKRICISCGRPLNLSVFRGRERNKATAHALINKAMEGIEALRRQIQEIKVY